VAPSALTFSAPIQVVGINPFVLVEAEQVAALRETWRRPLPVLVRINGGPETPWRTNMMPIGDGSFFLYLHGEMRKAAGVDVGDVATVELRFDDTYRGGPTHESPEWFERALEASPSARANWDGLSPSRRKEMLRYFAGLKTERAKERNLERALRVLGGENERFMARDWHDGH
jgi:Bacteriocin-protection, YdeI or OmpD-Associated/Domain of unknown function (DUF1905)